MTDNWEEDFDAEYVCPICGSTDVVPPDGDEKSPYLIIGAYPAKEEVKEHRPMAGKTGNVLKAELRKLGRDICEFRICNLWHHPPQLDKDDINYNKCFEYGATLAVKEAIGRKAILLIGADTAKYFCSCSVEAYNGLLITSQYLSAPIIMAMIQPTTVFKGGVGELRLALSKFVRQLEKLENE